MSDEAILIHGWNPDLYNNNLPDNPKPSVGWSNRPKLIDLLSDRFNLNYYNLPGFCGVSEPNAKHFNVEDFSSHFAKWKEKNCPNPSIIIGYSFGGVVALDYKTRYHDSTPIILISPAIFRVESSKSGFAKTAKHIVPSFLLSHLKHVYQLVTSPYYRKGTTFLRSTYDVIARRDLRPLLDQVNPKEIFLIYGTNDSDTPWNLVKDKVIENNFMYHLVSGGGHNIGATNPEEIDGAINSYLKK